MFNTEFIFGALKFIENTNSIEKIDTIINTYPLSTPTGDKKHSIYCFDFGVQVFTGLLVAKFNNRSNLNELVDQYTNFVKSEMPKESTLVKDYYKLVSAITL